MIKSVLISILIYRKNFYLVIYEYCMFKCVKNIFAYINIWYIEEKCGKIIF